MYGQRRLVDCGFCERVDVEVGDPVRALAGPAGSAAVLGARGAREAAFGPLVMRPQPGARRTRERDGRVIEKPGDLRIRRRVDRSAGGGRAYLRRYLQCSRIAAVR